MSNTVTITYDRALVRRALNRFFVRRLGKPFFVVLGLLILGFVLLYLSGSWDQVWTYLVAIVAFMLAFLTFVYFARLRAAEGFFDKANEPTVSITFSDSGVKTESDLGTSNLKWTVFDEILRFPDVWLLVYARSGYMTLPVNQLTAECQAFIEEMMATKDEPA